MFEDIIGNPKKSQMDVIREDLAYLVEFYQFEIMDNITLGYMADDINAYLKPFGKKLKTLMYVVDLNELVITIDGETIKFRRT